MRVEKNDVFFWNGLSPFLEASYSRTVSGVDAFSYDESSFVSVSKAGFDCGFRASLAHGGGASQISVLGWKRSEGRGMPWSFSMPEG